MRSIISGKEPMIQIAKHAAEQQIACLREHADEILSRVDSTSITQELDENVGDWLRLATEAYAWIKIIDERSLDMHRRGIGSYDPAEDASVVQLYRNWIDNSQGVFDALRSRVEADPSNPRLRSFLDAFESAVDEVESADWLEMSRRARSQSWADDEDVWPEEHGRSSP